MDRHRSSILMSILGAGTPIRALARPERKAIVTSFPSLCPSTPFMSTMGLWNVSLSGGHWIVKASALPSTPTAHRRLPPGGTGDRINLP